MEIIEKRVLSSDGEHELVGRVFLPDSEPKGLFHVVHGMTEHIARYEDFMTKMCENGYIVFGYDHLGHGRTARDAGELGFIAHEDGWVRLVDDVNVFGSAMREEYGKDLYFVLMGHSMGSFIVRLTAAKFKNYDKLIVMGTGGPNPIAGAGLALMKIIKAFKGEKHISQLSYKLAFGTYNSHFKEENDERSWLSVDGENRRKNAADPFCTFKFTVSAMYDLVKLNSESNTKQWFESMDKTKPVLLVSGSEDPVGDYSKGVETVYQKLTAAGVPVEKHIYEGYRHEVLNDFVRDEVTGDILAFVNK